MSSDLTTQDSLAGVVEQVVVGGDLSKLSAKDRLHYYNAICKSVGLNPLTRPFDYLHLSGKLVLYAKKDATDQLRKLHNVSIIPPLERETVEGIYVVTANARDKDGRIDSSIGAVPIENLKGEQRANAIMKAETKAKRRVTLSICGLGMLDETEVGSIPDARPVQIDYDTGEVLDGLPAAPEAPESDTSNEEPLVVDVDVERAIMYGKVDALAQKINLDANERSTLWLEHCGLAKKSNVDPAALHAMYAALLIKQKAKKDKA
jgi:hypothetical protein